MKRDRLYDNKSFDLLWEDGTYIIVEKDPDVKIIHRTLDEDIKLMQSTETVKTYLPKFNMVYNIFDCPSIDGKLLIYATDGDPHRHCFGKRQGIYKFFDTRELAEEYLMSDEFWGGKPADKWDKKYRENKVKKDYEIVEMPLTDVLNIILESMNELESRLDSHNL